MLLNENYETKFIENKDPKKIYISKRINHKTTRPDTGEKINIPLRYVSKVINSEKILGEVKEKGVLQLRITGSGKQEILAKVLEMNNKIYVLTLQRYTTETGSPHKVHFSFVGNEILELKNFIDSIILLNFPDEHKTKVESTDLLKIKKIFSENPDIGLIEQVLSNNVTGKDIVALGYRKDQLEIFEKLLSQEDYFSKYKSERSITDIRPESVWQHFFKQNDWIFGYGLNYVFNEPLAGQKLEQIIQGADVVQSGKRADGLLKSRGILNSLCLVEIKTHKTRLLKQVATPYRADSWQVSDDLNGGVVQSQKTIQKTIENIKLSPIVKPSNKSGDPTGEVIFSYQPKSYLIIGNLAEFQAEHGINREKFSSFELFRKNVLSPEIITFDELYERAKFIVYYNEQNLVK